MNLTRSVSTRETKQMFIFLLLEYQVNNSLKKYMWTPERRTIVYIDVGAMEDIHLRRSAVCIFFAYCVSFLGKQQTKEQTQEVHCFKIQLFQDSQIAKIIKASRGK